MTAPITFALNKGRILDETLPLLARAGIRPLEPLGESRRLIHETTADDVRLVVVRSADVPTYVELGAADIGITGRDTLLEHHGSPGHRRDGWYERLDLGISRCRLMTAAPVGFVDPGGRLRVATKFVNVAREWFARQGRQADVIRLSGAMELAPLMGLADLIVDIVDTGNTLRANGLEPRDDIADISARVIVNKASMKTRQARIQQILGDIASAVEAV